MLYIELLGYIATTLSIISFLPQVIKIIKTKSTKDLSLMMYLILAFNQILWLIYAMFINSRPLIIGNSILFLLCSVILIYKLRYR